jgi:N-acetylglucosamine kinase-like BadF-type ATPase
MGADDLLLGVDGGGTKTVAWLARRGAPDQAIGRGKSGPSNCRSVGISVATTNLDHAIAAAFDNADLVTVTVAAACLALAGADRSVEQQQIRSWAEDRNLASRLTISSDAVSVLYAASNEGVGIALIAGTGSLAFGRNAKGESARCGGWGGLFGDEGSGYQIALAALRAAAHAADGRGPQTTLLPSLLDHFKINDPSELIPVIYSEQTDRSAIAKLAPIVFAASESGDAAAAEIVDSAADELKEMVSVLATRLGLAGGPFALAVTGGVLLHQPTIVDKLRCRLTESGLDRVELTPVQEPAIGALAIAATQ